MRQARLLTSSTFSCSPDDSDFWMFCSSVWKDLQFDQVIQIQYDANLTWMARTSSRVRLWQPESVEENLALTL